MNGDQEEIKIGDYVRNKVSGCFGEVLEYKTGYGHVGTFSHVRVLVVNGSLSKFTSLWARKNIELIKDAKK